MARKAKPLQLNKDLAKDLWINPRSNIRGPDGNRGWDHEGNIAPSSGSRFIELADIALGFKKTTQRKKKPSVSVVTTESKTASKTEI